jgi:hypothetical protein
MQILTLKITHEVLKLIAEIDEFKGAWAAIGRISPDRLTSLHLSCALLIKYKFITIDCG